MTVRLNTTGGVIFSAPGGYPFALNIGGDREAVFVVPRNASSISVDVYADASATVHLGLFEPPTESGGDDGDAVVDRDSTGEISKTYREDATVLTSSSTLTLDLPTTRAPGIYVARLWFDDMTGETPDTVDRDGDDDISDEPPLPGSIHVTKVYYA